MTAQVDGRPAYDTDGTRPEAVSGWDANADIEVGGTTIAAGDLVVLDLRDANQNAERFPVPADFDVRRTDNPHVTFGHGPRFCVGEAGRSSRSAGDPLGRLSTSP